jgi:hypothetical protein
MAQEARELICMITRGTDHELSSVGLTIANGGITGGLKGREAEQSGPARRALRAVVTVRPTSWTELSSQERA